MAIRLMSLVLGKDILDLHVCICESNNNLET